MKNQDTLNKEKEILVQLYSNEADVMKYLPLFFNNEKELLRFFQMFGGKTLKLPVSYKDFMDIFMIPDEDTRNRRTHGINGVKNMRSKIVESYINLFPTLQDVIKQECKEVKIK